MRTSFVSQPDESLGRLVEAEIARAGTPNTVIVVSAFASLTTVLRFKNLFAAVRKAKGDARLTLGVDLGGTSKEVLSEVASWAVPVTIVKNRRVGIIFHPKIYVLAWNDRAIVFVGSNNLTDGGLFKNSEAASKTEYVLPTEQKDFDAALVQLGRFVKPKGPTAAPLTEDYLQTLLRLPEIPSEAEARKRRGEQTAKRPTDNRPNNVFGIERIPPPPKLPVELQKLLLAARNHQVDEWKKKQRKSPKTKVAREPLPPLPLGELDPTAFYMTLPAMKQEDANIPGEPRVPLQARDMAPSFWGWRDNYVRSVSPRAGAAAKEPRIYWNWRPKWRITSTVPGATPVVHEVRMYFYENSSDFRFYAGDLIKLHAKSGDIIRLARVDEEEVVFECTLAPTGTREFDEWSGYLTLEVKSGNSTRRFGYA